MNAGNAQMGLSLPLMAILGEKSTVFFPIPKNRWIFRYIYKKCKFRTQLNHSSILLSHSRGIFHYPPFPSGYLDLSPYSSLTHIRVKISFFPLQLA